MVHMVHVVHAITIVLKSGIKHYTTPPPPLNVTKEYGVHHIIECIIYALQKSFIIAFEIQYIDQVRTSK